MRRLLALLLLLSSCSKAPDTSTPEDPPPPKPPPPSATGLVFEPPAEWKSEPPVGAMRKAQYRIPDKDKAEGDATLVYFGALGGGVQANFERWKGQFKKTEGEPKEEEFKAGDLTVHVLDIAGDYDPGAMSGEPMKDARMLAAIIQTPGGDHHIFKLWGPRGTVGDWRDAFVEMLKKAKLR